MQAEQRAKTGKARFEPHERLWQPFTVHGDDGSDWRRFDVTAEDTYVVVEDIEDGRVVFEISRWPRIDHDGRLFFGGDPAEIFDDLDTAQEAINAARAGHEVTAPDRPLRIGDVFAVGGLPDDAEAIGAAMWIRDISLAGRNAAKAALYGAAASTVKPGYADEMAISGEVEESSPESGEYDVRQQSVTSESGAVRPLRGPGRGEQV
jgi:hypothetical protein